MTTEQFAYLSELVEDIKATGDPMIAVARLTFPVTPCGEGRSHLYNKYIRRQIKVQMNAVPFVAYDLAPQPEPTSVHPTSHRLSHVAMRLA
jgi:hypothetical protein